MRPPRLGGWTLILILGGGCGGAPETPAHIGEKPSSGTRDSSVSPLSSLPATPQEGLPAPEAPTEPPPPNAVEACPTLCDLMTGKAETCLQEAGRTWGEEVAGEAESSLRSPEAFREGCLTELVPTITNQECQSTIANLNSGRLGCPFISPTLFGTRLPSGTAGTAGAPTLR